MSGAMSGGGMTMGLGGAGMMPGMMGGGAATASNSEFSRRSDRQAEERVLRVLQSTPTPELNFPGETTVKEILNYLADHLSQQSGSQVRFVPDLTNPEIADPSFLETISLSEVVIPEETMSTGAVLDYLLSQVKDNELTWIVKSNLIVITTQAAARSDANFFLRSYDISSLRAIEFPVDTARIVSVGGNATGGGPSSDQSNGADAASPNAQSIGGMSGSGSLVPGMAGGPGGDGGYGGGGYGGGGMGGGGQGAITGIGTSLTKEQVIAAYRNQAIVEIVQDLSAPECLWTNIGDDPGGSLRVVGNRLLVRQTRRGHERVVEVLEELELAAEGMQGAPASMGSMGGPGSMMGGSGMPGGMMMGQPGMGGPPAGLGSSFGGSSGLGTGLGGPQPGRGAGTGK